MSEKLSQELPEKEHESILSEKKEEALDLVAKINELKSSAKTKEDYQQLTKLYQELEKIFEGGEGQELEPWLAEQYQSQIDILESRAIIYELKPGERELGFKGIDGKEYPVPTQKEIAELIEKNKELIEKKKEQGFTKLLLVPFGMKIDDLAKKYGELIIEHFKDGNLQNSEGKRIEDLRKQGEGDNPINDATGSSEHYPLWKWDQYTNADVDGKLVYYPESFDKNNHHGRNKTEVLKELGGWNIVLIEDMPDIPRQGKGKTVGDRKQLEANSTPKEYLQVLANDKIYQNESGMIPEDQLMYAITYLEENQRIMDDYQGKGSISYQIGAFFPASDVVPGAYWRRGDRRASMSRSVPGHRGDGCGVRSAVRIYEFTDFNQPPSILPISARLDCI